MNRKIFAVLASINLIFSSYAIANETISVVATKFPNGDVLKIIEPTLKKEGYDLKIKEIPSYSGHGVITVNGFIPDQFNNPNQDVVDGKYDANFFQQQIYLDEYNNLQDAGLVSFGKIFYIPFAIYLSPNYKNSTSSLIDIVKKHEGITVGVPSNYIDMARALKLLEAKKLIKLDTNEPVPNIANIVSNPYHMQIVEVDNEILPRLLENKSLDIIVMNSGRAYLKKLHPLSPDYMENSPDTYSNVVVAPKAKKDSPKLKALVKALQSPEVQKYLEQNYKGIVKPSF